MKVMVIKIGTCHLMNILTNLKLTGETIINLRNSDTWKIQLTIAINFRRVCNALNERKFLRENALK